MTADVIVVVVDMATACSVVMANDVYGMGSDGGGAGGFRAHTATNCVLMTVAVVSICALVVCGVLVVREYSLAMSYLPTDCRIGNITYARHDVTCKHCASGQYCCYSHYSFLHYWHRGYSISIVRCKPVIFYCTLCCLLAR